MADSSAVAGVYVIANLTNGNLYVGSSRNIERRWKSHRRELVRGRHSNRHLQHAWSKYGASSFTFALIERVGDVSGLRQAEQWWIDATGSANPARGYNLTPTAGSLLGFTFTDEQKRRLSTAMKGKPKSAAHRANIWRNREVTDDLREQCAAVGRAGAGVPKSPEHRAKIGAPQKGSANHAAKLTESDVREIRERLTNGERGRAIAADFGVHEVTISNIKRRKIWTHVQ